jgi:hypothetical protein
VKNYGSIAKPLTNLLHHKNFAWDAAIQAAFDQLKSAMTRPRIERSYLLTLNVLRDLSKWENKCF